MVETTPGDSEGGKRGHALDAMVALVTAWTRPATTTRRTTQVPLPVAFAAHCVAAVAFVLSFPLIEALMWHTDDGITFLGRWMHGCEVLIDDCIRYPFDAAMVVLGCEAAMLGIAVLLAVWGAKNEPIASSFRHSIRRTWLHSGHVVAITLLAGGSMAIVEEARIHQEEKVLAAMAGFEYPAYPSNGTQAEFDEYNKKAEAYRNQYAAIERRMPFSWLIRFGYRLVSFGLMAGVIWFLAALMRGVAANRPHERQIETLLCRECGYDLVATDAESRCPECGRPVRSTLTPPPDFAPPWQQAKGPLRLAGAYFATLWRASRQCHAMSLSLTMPPISHRYRWFLGLNLVMCEITALALCLAIFLLPNAYHDDDMLWIVAPWISIVWMCLLLGVLLLCAIIVGTAVRVRTGRNRLAPINQLACYASGFLVVWTFVWWIVVLVLALNYDFYEAWCREMGIAVAAPLVLGFWTLNLAMAIWMLIKLWRASAGVRYLMSFPIDSSPASGDAPDNMP